MIGQPRVASLTETMELCLLGRSERGGVFRRNPTLAGDCERRGIHRPSSLQLSSQARCLCTRQRLPLRPIGSAVSGRVIFEKVDFTLVASRDFVHTVPRRPMSICAVYPLSSTVSILESNGRRDASEKSQILRDRSVSSRKFRVAISATSTRLSWIKQSVCAISRNHAS